MENTSAGGSVSVTRFGTTDDLLGQLFTVTGQISPTNPLLIQANLEANGNASSSNGIGASYSANVSDTAQFLGVSFFADAAETIPVPDVQLGSALGFDYIPADAVLSPPTTAVPEISTWAMMLAGFSGLAAAALARDRKAAVT